MQQSADTGHMLPERGQRKNGAGAWIGIAIVVILLGLGALYFWGAYLNNQRNTDQLPFIPADEPTAVE